MNEFMRFASQQGLESQEQQCQLINALALSGPTHLSLLVAALAEDSPEIKDYAARALGRIGIATPPVVAALCTALSQPFTQVRQAAVVALSVLAPVPLAAEADLQAALSDSDDEVRFYANDTLKQIRQAKLQYRDVSFAG